jgi:hypothetical protein
LEKISVAMKKATFLPTNGSSYYGISGPAAAVGIATAAFVDTTPKRTFERNETLLATIDAQISNIEGLDKNQKETQNITEIINEIRNKMKYSISIEWPTQGFPACIKREIYNSIKAGLNYFNSMYEMNFKDSDILCTFSTRIPTCIKEHCRFYPKK